MVITNVISTLIVGSPGTIQRLIVVAGITADALESNCNGIWKSTIKILYLLYIEGKYIIKYKVYFIKVKSSRLHLAEACSMWQSNTITTHVIALTEFIIIYSIIL